MLPQFQVRESGTTEPGAVVGSVTAMGYGRETWVGAGWIGYLKSEDDHLIRGRWRQRGELWAFEPDEERDVQAIRAQQHWVILDGYWGERAELVLDRNRQWRKVRFEPTDAIKLEGRTTQGTQPELSDREIVESGWDHEHCAICWETIGTGEHATGYLSPPETWVCHTCYGEFVERRSLGFISKTPDGDGPPSG